MRRFEYSDDKSNKFWEISWDDDGVTTRWGRMGTDGQSKTKAVANPTAEGEKQIRANSQPRVT